MYIIEYTRSDLKNIIITALTKVLVCRIYTKVDRDCLPSDDFCSFISLSLPNGAPIKYALSSSGVKQNDSELTSNGQSKTKKPVIKLRILSVHHYAGAIEVHRGATQCQVGYRRRMTFF